MKTIRFISEEEIFIDGRSFRRVEHLNSPEFKVGDWVIDPNAISPTARRIIDIGIDELYTNEDDFFELKSSPNLRLATRGEIKSHLKNEAIKRGYRTGVKVKPLWDSFHNYWELNDVNISYILDNDTFYMDSAIYQKGKWAEIITDKKPLPKTKDDLYEFLVAFINHHNDDYQDFLDQYKD
jgi:hypothetical protein